MNNSNDKQIIDKVIELTEQCFGKRIKGYNPCSYNCSDSIYIEGTRSESEPLTSLQCVKDYIEEIKKYKNVKFDDGITWRNQGNGFIASDVYEIKLSKGSIQICLDVNFNDWIQISVVGSMKKYFNTKIHKYGDVSEYSHDVIFGNGSYKRKQKEDKEFWGPYLKQAKSFAKKYKLAI